METYSNIGRKRLAVLLLAVAAFFCIAGFLLRSLPGIQIVEIDMEIDHPDFLKIYYSNSAAFRERASSSSLHIGPQRSTVKASLGNSFANRIRIDTGERKGTAKIYQIKISSYFSHPVQLGPDEIGRLFKAGNPNTALLLSGDHVEVVASGNDPYITSTQRLFPSKYLACSLFALLYSVLLYLIAAPRSSRLPAPSGPIGATSGSLPPERLDALDGLRGLAAMMVIADHTCGWFTGLGATGVWIFFALSGFLLARPFLHAPESILSLEHMRGYLRRRFMRILPMYLVYIFIVFIMSGKYGLALLHALFLEGDGHLWAIPQEMLFYLLFPLVILCIHLPLKKHPLGILLSLFLLILAWNRFVGIDVFWLLGMNHIRIRPYFGVFLIGAFFASLHAFFWAPLSDGSAIKKTASRLASPLGMSIGIFFILFSTGHIFGNNAIYSQEFFGAYGVLAGLLIFCILAAKGRFLDRLLTLQPLRALGIVGLSLYLLHPLIKTIIQEIILTFFGFKLINFPLFLATLVVTYLLSTYTYSHIEQPGYLEKPQPIQ